MLAWSVREVLSSPGTVCEARHLDDSTSSRGARGHGAARAQEAAAEVLAESGVAELERVVLGFLYRHSGALRLLATVDDAAQLLLQARGAPRARPLSRGDLAGCAARRTSAARRSSKCLLREQGMAARAQTCAA